MALAPWILAALVPTALITYASYGFYLHPAWRRDRRVKRACAKAFDADAYRLVRLRLRHEAPSGADLQFLVPGRSGPPRYFTYRIEAEDAPDLSGMRREKARLVRHYLDRAATSPHHGTEVVHAGERGDGENMPAR